MSQPRSSLVVRGVLGTLPDVVSRTPGPAVDLVLEPDPAPVRLPGSVNVTAAAPRTTLLAQRRSPRPHGAASHRRSEPGEFPIHQRLEQVPFGLVTLVVRSAALRGGNLELSANCHAADRRSSAASSWLPITLGELIA